MRAGNNLYAKFWRYTYTEDDEVGGAIPSGTVLHKSVEGRIQASTPIPEIVAQGMEARKVVVGTFYPGTLDIQEFDQCEVISPPNHKYIGQRFRIDAVQEPNYHPGDPRGFLILNMTRSTKHGKNYQ